MGHPAFVLLDVLIPGLRIESWGTQLYDPFNFGHHSSAMGILIPFSFAKCLASS